MSTRSDSRVKRWENRTAGPLTVLAVLFLLIYALPILWTTSPERIRQACTVGNVLIWIVFGADYVARLLLSSDRRAFVRTHLLDLIVLVLPILRPLRMLRLLTALMVLNRRAEAWTRGRLSLYVGSATVMLVLVGGLAILDAERGSPDGNIATYPQAVWWAIVTVTTVGYGDHYPTTVIGRLVAVGLMMGGIGLIGFVTGSLATWIVERISTADRPADATRADIAEVLNELRELRASVAALRAEGETTGPADTDR
jgi:voltage-gated potassium channel